MLNQAIIHNNADSGDEVKSPDFPKTPLLRTMKESLLNFDVNLREGSSLGSIFNLCSATLGAGALSLPFAFSQCGLVAGTLFLFLAGFTTHLSIRLLIEASDKTTFNSYEMLTVQLFGGAMGVAVEFSILIFCFGTCIAYIVAVGDILEQGVLDVFDLPGFVNRDSLMILFWAFIMFPLSMLEKINSLRFASMFGVCSIFFLSFSISFHSIRDVILHDSWNYDASLWPESPTALVKSMPVVMFAFTCQVNVFSIYEELENKSAKRMNRVNVGAMKTCVVAYLLSGAFGYLDFGRTTQGNILKVSVARFCKFGCCCLPAASFRATISAISWLLGLVETLGYCYCYCYCYCYSSSHTTVHRCGKPLTISPTIGAELLRQRHPRSVDDHSLYLHRHHHCDGVSVEHIPESLHNRGNTRALDKTARESEDQS